MKNTKIVIEYRDGASYKTSETYIMQGTLTSFQKKRLLDLFGEDQMISLIPSGLGLDGLNDLCPHEGEDGYDAELDHPYHSILVVEDTNEEFDAKFSSDYFYIKAILQKEK